MNIQTPKLKSWIWYYDGRDILNEMKDEPIDLV